MGSGNGYHAEAFRNWGFDVTEIDLTRGVDLSCGRLLFKEPFNYIYARSIIEYIKNPLAFVEDCFNNLKQFGRIFVLTPNWKTQHRNFFENWRRCSPFTKRSLKMLMEDVGFSTVYCEEVFEVPVIWRWTNMAFSTMLFDWSHYIVYVGEKG